MHLTTLKDRKKTKKETESGDDLRLGSVQTSGT